jgi:hypothetical protein
VSPASPHAVTGAVERTRGANASANDEETEGLLLLLRGADGSESDDGWPDTTASSIPEKIVFLVVVVMGGVINQSINQSQRSGRRGGAGGSVSPMMMTTITVRIEVKWVTLIAWPLPVNLLSSATFIGP